jgi:ketosteroid isomerase-like protein
VAEGGGHDGALAELAARVALRSLVDAYALHVDRRQPAAVAALFTDDARFVAHFHTDRHGQPVVRNGRAKIEAALEAGLAQYVATTHVVGGHVVEVAGARAHGETVCLAHHVYERDGATRFLVMAVRYEDEYVCEAGTWRFASRQLRLDWRDDRPLDAGPGAR